MQLPISKGALPSRVTLSYIFDYVIIVVFILAFSALDSAEPHHQRFSLNNISLQYPFAVRERVPPWMAGAVSCAFPLLVIIIWSMLIDGVFSHRKVPSGRRQVYGRGKYKTKERLWEMNCGILGLGLSVAAAICITNALKNATGKPRPDIIARCNPGPEARDAPVFGLVSSEICTGDAHILKDGFKSWPSGHSSVAFAGLGYLSIYLCGKLHVLDNRGEVWKTVLVLIPLLAASLIAVSRIMDARHHPFDVISSSILGIFVAWVAYRQYFPPLSETWKKGRAHPMRSWATEPGVPPVVAAAETFLRAPAEEEGQAGYMNEPLSKARTTTGADVEAGRMERRRQYLEEQETLAWKRRQAHGYDTLIGPTVVVNPVSAVSQDAPHGGGDNTDESSVEEVDGVYELQKTKGGPPPVPRHTDTAYQGYQPYGDREETRSTRTTSLQDSEDRKWSIAQATSAITGGQSQAGSTPTPIKNFEEA